MGSKAGVEAVLSEYLKDLETDHQGVREVLRDCAVVLAATCPQSSSKQMQFVTESDNAVFETVIVDEAARANPLDLFIPMSKAERQVILVGDHRQLPHILEDDIFIKTPVDACRCTYRMNCTNFLYIV
ncbi:AAA domain-containing protein [Dendronalium sp. ChiSLP03b]|uniref:AAA domain-containing protein n=1 Tax=Dendronalium sp. ChiSLP03b TaxID=3075381 RepID=UPI002AD26FB0|nr:AAA domain-containing protein [Dendronalium sp. ChiSLP03b]MDZ8203179.1 AAA domain-containing protein [Dendronalium sp. ChiSLP03b]